MCLGPFVVDSPDGSLVALTIISTDVTFPHRRLTLLYSGDVSTRFLRNVLIIYTTSERKANRTYVVPAEVSRNDAWKSYGKERALRYSMVLFVLDLTMCKKREEALVTKISPLLFCLMVQFESVRRRRCGRCWGSINDGLLMQLKL